MEEITEILNTNIFLIVLTCISFISFIGFLIITIKFSKLNKKYHNFISKFSEGTNIEEDLENYIHRVENIEKQNYEINEDIKLLGKDLKKCIQKVGLVRYSAFKDTGSDLSFTLALLDEKDDGVVLNGIYSREMSNIYAKKVSKGVSNNTLSEEEKQAIKKAMDM
jgi:hypothetical protein